MVTAVRLECSRVKGLKFRAYIGAYLRVYGLRALKKFRVFLLRAWALGLRVGKS